MELVINYERNKTTSGSLLQVFKCIDAFTKKYSLEEFGEMYMTHKTLKTDLRLELETDDCKKVHELLSGIDIVYDVQ